MSRFQGAPLFGRKSPRGSSPILPLHEKRRHSDEYDLDELSPDTEEAVLARASSRREKFSGRSPSPERPWSERASSTGSASKLKRPAHLFEGPPPPIAASVMLPSTKSSPTGSRERSWKSSLANVGNASRVKFGSVLFDNAPRREVAHAPDSSWRALQRREMALEKELQSLLDMQASGLVAGSEAVGSSNASETDAFSEDGDITPTATFYSTVTSRSRMTASLDHPSRADARGDVIPVRQPKAHQPTGPRAARDGLRKSMAALAKLKVEEDANVELALSQRRKAVSHLRRLAARRESISEELKTLADDGDEPLATELRSLGDQHSSLDQEIRELEERLVGMRNRRRWLERKMDDVRNRREAGLSGYRGALREVEAEVSHLMRRPPIEPLDPQVLQRTMEGADEEDHRAGITSGEDFLRLIPERRTAAMATDWWESDIGLLESRKRQVDKEREALEDGLELWKECITLVTGFESCLRKVMNGDGSVPGKGKQKAPALEETLRTQLSEMGHVIAQLEDYVKHAEAKKWTLLICAIGAELEAFQEAESMLRRDLGSNLGDAPDKNEESAAPRNGEQPRDFQGGDHRVKPDEQEASESDNEVPPDLLGAPEDKDEANRNQPISSRGRRRSSDRNESDSDGPPSEFLAEHDDSEMEADRRG